MKTLYIIIILIVVLAVVLFFLLRKKKPKASTEGTIEEVTPLGTSEEPGETEGKSET